MNDTLTVKSQNCNRDRVDIDLLKGVSDAIDS